MIQQILTKLKNLILTKLKDLKNQAEKDYDNLMETDLDQYDLDDRSHIAGLQERKDTINEIIKLVEESGSYDYKKKLIFPLIDDVHRFCDHNELIPTEVRTFNGGDVYVRYDKKEPDAEIEFNRFIRELRKWCVFTRRNYSIISHLDLEIRVKED